LTEGNRDALLKDAGAISETKDIKHQREHFANLSSNMIVLAKAVKLSSDPIYEAYCPMKKASWLSSEKVIKNPYYGSAMLTCGSVRDTLK
jgi:DNA-binding transcriptional regulator WhiA